MKAKKTKKTKEPSEFSSPWKEFNLNANIMHKMDKTNKPDHKLKLPNIGEIHNAARSLVNKKRLNPFK